VRCEEFELALLSSEPLSAEATAHTAQCASCKAFAAEVPGLLAAASMPPPSAPEKARLDGLAASVLRQYQADRPKRSVFRQLAPLALAAGLGAVVTSAVFKLSPVTAQASAKPDAARVAPADQSGFGDGAFDGVAAGDEGSDDESLEVSWPSINEGDVQ
jgi:anti-sigma factor RsiW